MFLFYFINYQLARTLWNRDNFFRFPCSVVIEISPLFQTTPVLTKKITVEGMGVFFPISDKGWKEKKKEKEGERNVQSSIN